jgi:hypothetical protein
LAAGLGVQAEHASASGIRANQIRVMAHTSEIAVARRRRSRHPSSPFEVVSNAAVLALATDNGRTAATIHRSLIYHNIATFLARFTIISPYTASEETGFQRKRSPRLRRFCSSSVSMAAQNSAAMIFYVFCDLSPLASDLIGSAVIVRKQPPRREKLLLVIGNGGGFCIVGASGRSIPMKVRLREMFASRPASPR